MITYEDIKKANESLKTTDIKGKDYTEVNQRIKAFRMVYPQGSIITELVSNENGICIFRATINDGDGMLLGTGTAYEKENSTFINKTSYIENCVPLDTQILTKGGWKYYYQLKTGDEVYSMNLETKKVELCKLLNINTYKDKAIKELKTSRFKVRCTDAHKWVVRSQYKGIEKVPTSELKVSHKIIQNIPQSYIESYDGRKLGWLMCDCEIVRTKNGMPSRAEIKQSKHVDDIKYLFGEPTSIFKYNNGWKDSYYWNISADETRKVLGHFRISDYSDLIHFALTAEISDIAGCYKSMMLADGTKKGFSSTYKELVEAMQIMCVRLGISTTFIKSRMMKNSTKPIYELGVKKGDGAYYSEMKIKNLPPQDVWCPTTENGTWFMKQGSFVTLTSNCETSAVGRALGMCGFGIDTSVASSEEVKNEMANQEEKPKQKATPKQLEIIKENATNIDNILAYYKVKSIEELSLQQASAVIKKLQKQKGVN